MLAVLPHPEDNAKDLGVFDTAQAALLTVGDGQNHTLLCSTAAGLTLLGAPAIFPVKEVK